ncbi:MAB_1171c family putative transporter [Kitasatospora purpeofusca]|uniref:MAB_1171c family putative transporter n=1 Tax=Kitasatospora purpeofusca TaxID=67352 RepID=UPI0036D333CC
MRPFDLAVLPPVWILTLWSLRGLLDAPRRARVLRAMWACWAVSMTLGAPVVRRMVDAALGVASVTNLLVHLAGLAATATALEFVREITGRAHGRVSRLNLAGLAAAAAALTALFAAMPRPDGEVDLLTYAQGSFTVYLYWVVLTADIAIGVLAAARLWWVHGRHAAPGPMRTSLQLMRVSTVLASAYLAHRLWYLTVRQCGREDLAPAAVAGTSQVLLALGLVLFALSVAWPSLADHRQKRLAVRQADRIAPLWRLLQSATPGVALPLPQELRRHNPRLRLYRYVIEIRDSALTLERHLDAARQGAAEAELTAAGLGGGRLAPAVEAALLRYAAAAELAGVPAGSEGRPEVREALDLEAEIAWFEQVAAAVELPAVVAAARRLAAVSGVPGGGGGAG